MTDVRRPLVLTREDRAQMLRAARERAAGLPDDEELEATLAARDGQVCVRLGAGNGIAVLTRAAASRLRDRLGHLLSLDPSHAPQPAASAATRETT